jgi:hypothetical protein
VQMQSSGLRGDVLVHMIQNESDDEGKSTK